MPRTKLYLLAVLAVALCSTGCRNCNCGGAAAAPFGAWRPFGGPVATTVPAPPTNTLNIPQTAQQLPYYVVPQTGQQPTPASAVPSYQAQPQNGWRQVNPANSGALNQNLNPTSFTQARNPNLPVTGTSQTLNPNYQTTTVDERTDRSRLAVTDASQVRAPARFFPTATNNRLLQTPVATTAAAVPNPQFAQTGFGQPINPQQFQAQSQFQSQAQSQGPTAIRGSVIYQGQLAANTQGAQYGTNVYGNGAVANYGVNPPVTSTNATVLAQSTTDRTNVASNTQAGWRSAQPGQNLNR